MFKFKNVLAAILISISLATLLCTHSKSHKEMKNELKIKIRSYIEIACRNHIFKNEIKKNHFVNNY